MHPSSHRLSSLLSISLNYSLIQVAFIWSISNGSLIYYTSSHSITSSNAYFHYLISAIGPFCVFSRVLWFLYLEKICKHLCQFLGSFYISGSFILLVKYSFANLFLASLTFSYVHSVSSLSNLSIIAIVLFGLIGHHLFFFFIRISNAFIVSINV